MQTGIQLVQRFAASGQLRHVVLVGLGTNAAITAAQVWQLREAAGPGHQIVLVNVFGPMPWGSEVNAVLAGATWHKPHVVLVDWAGAIAGRPYLLWGDGVHPRPSGASLYARLVTNTLRSTC
jgi:hypothetical protein